MRSRIGYILGLTAVMAVSVAQSAFATAQDYTSLTSGFAAELTAALPVALAAVGTFIGVIMAYKVVRRILRA
jgi:predicted ABC-type sugar transport system permease subunit